MKLNYLPALLISLVIFSCSSEDEYPVIEADFEVQDAKTFAFVPLQFESVVDGAYAYFWDFGNGVTSNEKNPNPIYQEPGTYKVSLTTTSLNKVKNTVSKEIKIGAYFITKITALPNDGYTNENLRFVIEQRVNSNNVIIDQNNIPSEASTTGDSFQISSSRIAFAGANFDNGFPILRIFDANNDTEILNSYNIGGSTRLMLNEDQTLGKASVELGFRSPYNFEFEFVYGYVD